MKKIFIISAVSLLVVMFFLGIYNIVFKKNKTVATENQNQQEVTSQNSSAKTTEKKIIPISEQEIIGPLVKKSTEKLIYYAKKDGTVWESDLKGAAKTKIESTELTGLQNVFWSKDGKKSISEFLKAGEHYFYQYDHSTGKGIKLSNGTDYAVWDDSGSKILYKFFDEKTKKRSLNISNPDGTNWEVLAEIPYLKVSIAQIPHTSLVAFWNYPSASEESFLRTVSTLGGEVKTIFSGKFGGDYNFSPDGNTAIASVLSEKNGKKISLGLIDIKDGSFKALNVPTLAEKTIWSASNKVFYYALPISIGENAVLPDDYQSKKLKTSDTFWKFDILTGKNERIVDTADITQTYDASNLMLSPNEDGLFFLNRLDGKLYRINL
jgi:hypothetical protein